MIESQKLLVDYATHGSEAAFQALVAAYLDLVYSVAFRLVDGDAPLAEDVTQTVFIDLARLAKTLSGEVRLGGWLHRHTYFVAAKTMRGERRRRSRERHAVEMNALPDHSAAHLDQVAPILDEAINELGAADRAAILLRFFEQLDFRSVGRALGSNEAAAQKRVSRALEKLRLLLKRRGVAYSAAALGTALAGQAVTAAPAGLAVSISATSVAAAAAGGGASLALFELLTMTKLKAAILGTVVIAGVATPLLIQRQSQALLRDENLSLRRQLAQLQADNESLSNRIAQAGNLSVPRLPAPRMQAAAPPPGPAAVDMASTNLYARLKDKSPTLTDEQAAAYLKANKRSAASLLAAFRTTGDPALLAEAKQKYPNDPQVDFEAVFAKDASPEDRRQWLDALKQSAPGNALPNYLSALGFFQSGQTDQAVQDLIAAAGKAQFQDYTLDRIQDDEEAYLSAGYSVAEAKTISSMQLLLPQLAQVKELGQDMMGLANSYQTAGDPSSAQSVLQMTASLGQRYADLSEGEPEISQLVGMALEHIALGAMDPNSPFGSDGQTVQDQLDQLAQQKAALQELNAQVEPLFPLMSDQDWISYKDRWRLFGEEPAMRWVISKYGQ